MKEVARSIATLWLATASQTLLVVAASIQPKPKPRKPRTRTKGWWEEMHQVRDEDGV